MTSLIVECKNILRHKFLLKIVQSQRRIKKKVSEEENALTVSTKLDVVNLAEVVEAVLLILLFVTSLESFLSFSLSFSVSFPFSSFLSFSLLSFITELEPDGGGKSSLVAVPLGPTIANHINTMP